MALSDLMNIYLSLIFKLENFNYLIANMIWEFRIHNKANIKKVKKIFKL
jgi:hypothetical protein